jgi:S-(hydroxymethyl)glutathione dehydrogenase/alcohol dehydrogenase
VIEGVRAAVFDGTELVVVDDLEVPEPGPGEVTVRVLASGICHSDLNVVDGTVPVPPPVVLGHEAAGVVDRLGEGVEGWAVGNAVLVGGLTACGTCRSCRHGHPTACPEAFGRGATPFRWRGQAVRLYANVSSFSTLVTVAASQLTSTEGLPPTQACVIGCAVSTGYSVARNAAGIRPGDRVAVLGVGGIGANVVQTAKLLGAAEVTAVDVDPGKEPAARHFGADRFVLAGELDGQFDVVVECSGAPAAIDAAIAATGPGGTTALVGLPPVGHRASFDVGALMRGRRIVGSLAGDLVPERDTPAIVEHVRRGELDVAGLVSDAWPLEGIHDAIAAMRAGQVVRAVLDLT